MYMTIDFMWLKNHHLEWFTVHVHRFEIHLP